MLHVRILTTLPLLAAATMASAQATTAANSQNPVIKDSSVRSSATPARGANSFSMDQAKGRLTKAGFTDITGLTKSKGLWMAKATKGAKSFNVALDYKGNVTAR